MVYEQSRRDTSKPKCHHRDESLRLLPKSPDWLSDKEARRTPALDNLIPVDSFEFNNGKSLVND